MYKKMIKDRDPLLPPLEKKRATTELLNWWTLERRIRLTVKVL